MVALCPNCSRANASEASYCYFDGVALKDAAGPMDLARQTFPHPLVFPTGIACRNFDELAQGIHNHWREAGAMLEQGALRTFLAGLGRLDLAAAADEAARFPDRDAGLDQFVGRLPARPLQPPRLEAAPASINVGVVPLGTDRRVQVTIRNAGQRLLSGTVSADVPWLVPETARFACSDRCTLTVQIRGSALRAGPKPQQGTLTFDSNGGVLDVVVTIDVPVTPFMEGSFAGARTPRELAEKAVKAPKAAAPIFESGAVQRWYEDNGWTYPVQGPSASGLGAVQQFFEALGLVKPPKIEIAPAQIKVYGKPGEVLEAQLRAFTSANRPVYAAAASDVPWVSVERIRLKGAEAIIPLRITAPDVGSKATLRVTANGQQRFEVPVEVVVVGVPAIAAAAAALPPPLPVLYPAHTSAAPVAEAELVLTPVADDAAVPVSAVPVEIEPDAGRAWPLGIHLIPTGILMVLMLLIVIKDALTDAPKAPPVAVVDEAHGDQAGFFKVAIEDDPDDINPLLVKARIAVFDEPEERLTPVGKGPVKVEIKDEPPEINAAAAGIVAEPIVRYIPGHFFEWGLLGLQSPVLPSQKPLTYTPPNVLPNGSSSSTAVSVNGTKYPLGDGSRGRVLRQSGPLAEGVAPTPGAVQGTMSSYAVGQVVYHQVLELVPGQPVTIGGQSRRFLDTVLVRYVIHNKDSRVHRAGLRHQLDTLIGREDGVPFTVPGLPNVINSQADFRGAQVPDFVQALEYKNLRNPGTISHLTVKTGRVEPPDRLCLTRWPAFKFYAWEVPVQPMGDDSAVVLYWAEKPIPPGGKREIGFAYGLGSVAANDKLGVTFGGSFEPGSTFTITATVENPVANQTLRLELPEGLTRAEGSDVQAVPRAGLNNSGLVTWKAKVERAGQFTLKVSSSTGLTQAKTISISQEGGASKVALDLDRNIELGRPFKVAARIEDPVAGETVTLQLPAGVTLFGGAATQTVPAAVGNVARVEWSARVGGSGRHTLRVVSSTGAAARKTLQIEAAGPIAGNFKLDLRGNLEPGRPFDVFAIVGQPERGQRLTLEAPPGMKLLDGTPSQAVAGGGGSTVRWSVQVDRTGRFPIRVSSSTGVAQSKTLQIDAPGDAPGRFTFEFAGDIAPGKDITVRATVEQPVAGQTLTLVLPAGMELLNGQPNAKVVAEGGKGTVTWPVRVLSSGRLPVRIESSTGLARTKTINLTESKGGIFNQ